MQLSFLIYDECMTFIISQSKPHSVNFINKMDKSSYPIPHSHKTFDFGSTTIDSNFDSGNLYNAQKISNTNYNIWIAVDHVKNQYRTWFHFSIKGLTKGTVVTFNIKNMQNQSRLLRQGLVPVFREDDSKDWNRIAHKVDVDRIEFNEGWIQWSFRHTMTSNEKVFFAFFYPWSNTDNEAFLNQIQQKCKAQPDLYFKRSNIIRTIEGRPVEFLTISSKKYILNKNEKFQNQNLFVNKDQPKEFAPEKKCFIIGARVHPGQVPSSHVMTGIISELTEDNEKARLLRDKFVFYLFPIFNPDGVARGHYRVDTNGINLNRCYINPSPKNHPSIYAVKKVITHFHSKNKYFGFLDLHAHAARKGVFIYGNSTNQLEKQVNICLFPKILSLNSEIFQYEGSNFTEKNMYCKDINDHVSKQGAGRVALFKATKNPFCWTLECNYNTSRVINNLVQPRQKEQTFTKPNQKTLDIELITTYKQPNFREPKQFYTIQHFRQLGKQICDSLLDLTEINPQSRIDNQKSHYKSVQNLKLNLAVALLRMAPNRFEAPFKKIFYTFEGPSTNKQSMERGIKALYYLLVRNAKIENLGTYLKQGNDSLVILPKPSVKKTISYSNNKQPSSPAHNIRHARSYGQDTSIRIKRSSENSRTAVKLSRESIKFAEESESSSLLKMNKVQCSLNRFDSDQSEPDEGQEPKSSNENNYSSMSYQLQSNKKQAVKISNVLNSQLLQVNFTNGYQKIMAKNNNEAGIEALRAYRRSFNSQSKKVSSNPVVQHKKAPILKSNVRELPTLVTSKLKAMVCISSIDNEIKLLKKGKSLKESNVFYYPTDVV